MAGTSSRVTSSKKLDATKVPPSQPEVNPPKPFFPYARYTSLVGVHCSLLVFTAIFLPRGGFADFSTPEQAAGNKRDGLILLTESPGRTVAWMCTGCFLLQWWWASWVREWALEASVNMQPLPSASDNQEEEEAERTKRKMRQQGWDNQKPAVLMKSIATTLTASVVFHIIGILFGAHFASLPFRTYSLALLVSFLTVWTPAYVLGPPLWKNDSELFVRRLTWIRLFAELNPRTPIERAIVYPAIGAVLGCWTGVIPIGLDWDRPWQAWPLTPAWGALGGYILGSMWGLLVNNLAELVDLGLQAKRDDDTAQQAPKKKKTKKPTN